MNEQCQHKTYPGALEEPAEYCENDAVNGEYCEQHAPWDDDEDNRLIIGYGDDE